MQYLFGLEKTNPLSGVLDQAGLCPAPKQTVVALLIDGFGYAQWLRYSDRYEFLKRLTARGVVAPITAVFPSTTAAALTAIHSGLTPQQHGLPEWWVYFRELGQVIVTLPFRPLGGKIQDQLLGSGVDPRILFDGQTWYGSLAESGIQPFNFVHGPLAGSAYSSVVMKNSNVVPYADAPDLMRQLCARVGAAQEPAYFHAYWGKIDEAAHEYGPHSDRCVAEMDQFFSLLQEQFVDRLPSRTAEHTVLLVMADHGQICVEPEKTIYLNEYPELVESLRVGPDGSKILPWGRARDVFVGVRQEKLDEVSGFLSDALKDRATVLQTGKALQYNLFGHGTLHSEFKSRIGDILILPHGNLTLWFERPYQRRFRLLGMHGGLSRDEMLVPLAVARMSELKA